MATFDATLGGPDATSYVGLTTADAFFAGTAQETTWAALADTAKEAALMQATLLLDGLQYNGIRCDVTQALSWPRSGVTCDGVTYTCTELPRPIVNATCLLAFELSKDPSAVIGGASASTGPVQSQTLGELSQSYYEPKDNKIGLSAPLVLQRFPWLVDLLPTCLLLSRGGSSGILLRVRA